MTANHVSWSSGSSPNSSPGPPPSLPFRPVPGWPHDNFDTGNSHSLRSPAPRPRPSAPPDHAQTAAPPDLTDLTESFPPANPSQKTGGGAQAPNSIPAKSTFHPLRSKIWGGVPASRPHSRPFTPTIPSKTGGVPQNVESAPQPGCLRQTNSPPRTKKQGGVHQLQNRSPARSRLPTAAQLPHSLLFPGLSPLRPARFPRPSLLTKPP